MIRDDSATTWATTAVAGLASAFDSLLAVAPWVAQLLREREEARISPAVTSPRGEPAL